MCSGISQVKAGGMCARASCACGRAGGQAGHAGAAGLGAIAVVAQAFGRGQPLFRRVILSPCPRPPQPRPAWLTPQCWAASRSPYPVRRTLCRRCCTGSSSRSTPSSCRTSALWMTALNPTAPPWTFPTGRHPPWSGRCPRASCPTAGRLGRLAGSPAGGGFRVPFRLRSRQVAQLRHGGGCMHAAEVMSV